MCGGGHAPHTLPISHKKISKENKEGMCIMEWVITLRLLWQDLNGILQSCTG